MGAVISVILSALSLLPGALSGVKALFTAVTGFFSGLGETKAAAVAQQGVDITGSVEADATAAVAWFNSEFPTIEALLAYFPDLPKLVYSASNIQQDQGVTQHQAVTAAQLGAAALKGALAPGAS